MDKIIKLQSSDGRIFVTDMGTVKSSGTIVKFLEDNNSADIVPVTNVNAEILRKVLVWAKHYKDKLEIPNYINAWNRQFEHLGEHHIDEPQIDNLISPWGRRFLRVDCSVFFKILLAAYDLDMGHLLAACRATVGEVIRNRPPAAFVPNAIPPGG